LRGVKKKELPRKRATETFKLGGNTFPLRGRLPTKDAMKKNGEKYPEGRRRPWDKPNQD